MYRTVRSPYKYHVGIGISIYSLYLFHAMFFSACMCNIEKINTFCTFTDLNTMFLSQFNNYQTIIVSDAINTYVVFLYMCGGIQWSGLRTNNAVAGFNAEGKYFSNLPFSGYAGVGDALSCNFDLGKRRRKRQTDMTAPLIILLPPGETPQADRERCITASNNDKIGFILLLEPQVIFQTLATMLDPCPCKKSQADMDGQFRQQDDLSRCYATANHVPYQTPNLGIPITLTQQCCYDENNG